MRLILGITGAFAVVGAAAGALASTSAGVAVRNDNPGLTAWVGVGESDCGDNIATQQQGGTGKLQNKACYTTGNVVLRPSIGSLGVVGNTAGSVSNSVAGGNVIDSSPMGIGNSQFDGVGV